MKRKKLLLTAIILLITLSIFTYFMDLKNYNNNIEPKHCIKVINKDDSKVTYYGLGYKIIRYVNVSPVEPFSNNKGSKFGSWFMKYDLPSEPQEITDIETFYQISLTQNKNINSLPSSYTVTQAEEDNCLILTNKIINKKEYEDFFNEYNNHKNSFIRIVETTIEGDLLIYDLLYYNDFLYLVTDYSRDKYATETDKELSLEKYKYLSNYKYKNKTYLVLNNEEINENNFKNGTVFTISK